MLDYIEYKLNTALYDNLSEADKVTMNELYHEYLEWNDHTSGHLPPRGNLRLKPIGHGDKKSLPGAWMYKYYKAGLITSIKGIDKLNHYVKKDLVWMNTVIDSNTITNEEGVEVTTEITNKDKYSIRQEHINDTHCLVKLTDQNFVDFLDDLVFTNGVATTFFCNDKYDDEYKANFYVAPENPEI